MKIKRSKNNVFDDSLLTDIIKYDSTSNTYTLKESEYLRIRIPKTLFIDVYNKWQNKAKLKTNERVPYSKFLIFLLLLNFEHDQQDILIDLFDNSYHSLHKMLSYYRKTSGKNNTGTTELMSNRDILDEMLKIVSESNNNINKIYHNQKIIYDKDQILQYGLVGALSFLILDRIGLLKTKYPNNVNSMYGLLSGDDVSLLSEYIERIGMDSVDRKKEIMKSKVNINRKEEDS